MEISRQGFYRYLARQDRPWKYQELADAMRAIHEEDRCNDTYGRRRMRQALLLAQPEGVVRIPSEGTVRRVMEQIGLIHRPKHRPNSVTKDVRETQLAKSAISVGITRPCLKNVKTPKRRIFLRHFALNFLAGRQPSKKICLDWRLRPQVRPASNRRLRRLLASREKSLAVEYFAIYRTKPRAILRNNDKKGSEDRDRRARRRTQAG